MLSMQNALSLSLTVCVCVRVSAVRASECVRNFRVLGDSEGDFHLEDEHHFDSLPALVHHYRSHSLSDCGLLGNPCERVRLGPFSLTILRNRISTCTRLLLSDDIH